MVNSALELASLKPHSMVSSERVVQHVEQVGDVETDIERLAIVLDFDLFLRFFLLGVGGHDLQTAVGKHQANAAELLVGQNRCLTIDCSKSVRSTETTFLRLAE
jgi:hypothetical protein